jgi:HK97 family phage portal protein
MSWRGALARFIAPPEMRGSLENPRYSLDDPAVMDALWYDNGSLPPVRPQRAVQTSAVYACVRVLAQAVASLPLHTYRRLPNAQTELADDTDIYRLLRDEPNTYQTSYVFREQAMAQAALWGNFYAEIQRDATTGRPIGLYPLPAWEVIPELVMVGGRLVKRYVCQGQTLEDDEVFHIPSLGWDGVKGVSPIALSRASITMSLNAEEFGANFMKNGTRLSGVLTHPGNISKEAADRLRASWQDTYAGKANAGKVAVLEEGMKFDGITMPLADAQYLENRKFQVSDIARIFGVPPHKIGDLDRSTNNNIETQGKEFLSDTLRPWLARWEQEVNRKLFTPIQKKRYFARFDVTDILRGDMKTRFAAYAIARQWGWYSANDIRAKEDENAIEDGDVYLSPMNMVPADQVDKQEDTIEGDPTQTNGAGDSADPKD